MDGHLARISIFLDFWNFTLKIKDCSPDLLINWFALPTVLTNAAAGILAPAGYANCLYQDMFVCGSYDKKSEKDRKLHQWTENTLKKVPGVTVNFVPRQKVTKGPACLGKEHHEIKECPECRESMLGSKEKGVDTDIAIKMISRAWEGAYDVGIIVSEDKDFIPVIEYLKTKGFKFIHVQFPGGFGVTKSCWGKIDILSILDKIRR